MSGVRVPSPTLIVKSSRTHDCVTHLVEDGAAHRSRKPGSLPGLPPSEAAFFMRSPTHRTPSLRRHKPSAQGVVTLNGRDHYLGAWPPTTKCPPAPVQAAYDRLIAEWLAA